MNAVARIALGLVGLASIVWMSGCAVATGSDGTDEGSSSSELTSGSEAPAEGSENATSGATVVRLPGRPNTKAAIVAPGTENAQPGDPSPWRPDPKH